MTDTTTRTATLRQMLSERRRELLDEVQSRIRRGRNGQPIEVRDDLEHSDTDIQDDIDRSLLQMGADTVARIDAAIERLDAGRYGSCVDCEREIAERRLRALPFAVRCQSCQEAREVAEGQVHRRESQRGGLWLFPETIVA